MALPAAQRPEYSRLHYEPLEDRRVLAAYINEIYFDPPGGGGDVVFEYVELRGDAGASLDNYYFLQIENEGPPMSTPGGIDMIIDLNGKAFGGNGFLTLRQKNPTPNQYTVDGDASNEVNTGSGAGWGSGATSSIGASDDGNDGEMENSGGTFMLIYVDPMTGIPPSLTGGIGHDVDGNPIPPTGWTFVDAIGVHAEGNEAAQGRLYAQVNFGRDASLNFPMGADYVTTGFEIEYVARWGNSTGQTAADWHASNLTDDALSNHKAMGDFRQSGEPHGVAVAGRNIFYNQSKYDGNTSGVSPADSSAIDTGKSAYTAGSGTIASGSMTSYSKGLNGLMVDFGPNPAQTLESSKGVAYGTIITGTLGTTNISSTINTDHRNIDAGDFIFKMSGQAAMVNNSPSSWVDAPAPLVVTVLTDTPSVGTDRIEIIWANNVIENRYLQVTVKGRDFLGDFNASAGLLESDVFYLGNRIGDAFNDASPTSFATNGADEIAVRAATPAFNLPVANSLDFDKNGALTANDQIVSRGNVGFQLKINIPGPPPSAPAPDGAVSAVLSALAVPGASRDATRAAISASSAGPEAEDASIVRSQAHLEASDDPRARLKLGDDVLDDILGLDDGLLDALASADGSREV